MGNKESHILKAWSNNEFLNTIDLNITKHLDWAIVAIFYTALHYIDAYLATKGHIEIRDHRERNELIQTQIEMIRIRGRP